MNLDAIFNLIKHGESQTLEFKRSTGQIKSTCETLCAFLNSDGGIVLIGVTDQGRIVGQEISDKTKREIGNELIKIHPVSKVEVTYIYLPNNKNQLIVLQATTDSTKRPYMYDGKAFIRVQSDTLLMPREYLNQLIMSNADTSHNWEDQTQDAIKLEDLDVDEIIGTIREGVLNGRIPESYSTQEPWLALQRLGLIKNNKVTNAGIVLFGKHPEKIFPQCLLRMARFKGTTKSEFIDNKQISGNIFTIIRAALGFANTHLPIASVFPKDSLHRKDIPLFPTVVLREAIANAVCHRNYSYHGGSISFGIYDGKIELWSYGLLPPGIELASLTHISHSVPRNRRIANVLYYHKLFESWGRGIEMIVDECKKAGHPEPIYTQESGGIKLTLPSKQIIGVIITGDSENIHRLTRRQLEIIDIFKQYGELSAENIHEYLIEPPSARSIRNDLLQLKKLGYIDFVGKTRSRKWFLVK